VKEKPGPGRPENCLLTNGNGHSAEDTTR